MLNKVLHKIHQESFPASTPANSYGHPDPTLGTDYCQPVKGNPAFYIRNTLNTFVAVTTKRVWTDQAASCAQRFCE